MIPKKNLGTNIFLLVLIAGFFRQSSVAEVKPPAGSPLVENYSLSRGEAVSIPAHKITLPLVVYGDQPGQESTFVPSGYMGDFSGLEVKPVRESAPVSNTILGEQSLRVAYLSTSEQRKKSHRDGWAGVYWQTPANNWASVKGAGYDLTDAEAVTFWLRGEKGGEIISEIKVGGLTGAYPDTDVASMGPIHLNKNWTLYTLKLQNKDLRHISGGFAFVVRRIDNPRGLVFYIDEIAYRGHEDKPELGELKVSAHPAPQLPVSNPHKFIVSYRTKEAPLEEMYPSLDDVIKQAKMFPTFRIRIEGYTDGQGPEDSNQKISLDRAKAAADYFVKAGLDAKRIKVEGYGEENLLAPESGDSEEARAKNRRLEIYLQSE